MVTGKSMNASNSARIERIFASSDRNEDGCLDKSEFAELLRCVNNDVGLDDGQVALILDEVWASFPKHLGPHGLTLDGLKQIYLEGYADVERDYEAFVRARGDDTAAAIQHVSGGRLGMAAGTRQLALADASPAKGDIFSAVKPPAGAADSDDDASTSLTFALLVPGTATEEEFAASGQRQQLLSALRDSLPDGSSARVASMIPTAGGLAVGVLCALPSGAQEGDEVQYFNTVMAAEPEQIFPASTFGQVKVVSASPEAAASASAASAASAEAAAAAALAGAPGKVAMAFTVRLPKVDAASFARVKGARFMAQMQAAMPPGASAKVAHVATSPGGGLLVTVGAAVPVAQGTQAAQFLRKLRGDPGSVLSAKDFGPPWLVAASKATAQAPALAVQVRVPAGAPEGEQQQRAQALAGALITALPEGSTTAVRSVESDTQGRKDGALVTLIAALPASTSTAEYRRIAAELQASGWIPGSPTAPKAHCIAAGGALELAFGPESEDDGLHFGLGTSGNGRSRSPSPTRALFGRLFGRTAQDRGQVTAQVDAAGASPPSPTSPPADAIIAGYQRRSPSSAGSAGLADAVGELHLAEATTPASVSPAVAAALAAAAEVSPLKRGDDKAAAPVISVVAYAGKQEEKPAVADVVPADEETDGAAVDAAGARAGVEQQPGQEVQAEQQGESLGQHEMSSPSKSGKKGMWRSLLGALSPSKQRPVGVAPSEATAPPENGGAGPSGAATAAQGGELEAGPQALTPYEVQQRLNAKEWAVMDAHVGQIMAQLQYTLDAAAAAGVVADVSSVQDAASMLPAWARHAAHMDIGDKLGQYGMFEEAARSFMEAAAAWSDDPLARFRLGNAHFALQRYNESSRAYFEALKRCAEGDPLLVKVHINMGIALESTGRVEAAHREYSKAAVLATGHPRVHKLVGSAALALGRAPEAVVSLKRALDINPDFADAWADLGCAHAALGDVIEAQRCLKEALDIDPDHIEAHFNLGNVLRQCHDMRAALAHYDAVLDLDPDHWRTLLNKAITLACLGNTARSREAVECLQRAVECSGHGGVLASEVEALKALMVGGANLDTLSQQASVIEDKARRAAIRAQNQAEGGGSSMISGSASMSASVSVSVSASQGGDGPGRGGGADLDTASSGALSRMNSGPAPAVGGGVAPGGIPRQYGVSPSKLVRTASNASSSPSKRGARERVAAWHPPAHVHPADFGPEIRAQLRDAGLEPTTVLTTLDMTLLQQLQPCSCVPLEDIWAETREYQPSNAISQGKTKLVPLAQVHAVLLRLVHAAPAHLAHPLTAALFGRILPLMDYANTGRVDLALVLCVMTALADAPSRERLDLTYRLLMWRTRNAGTGAEDPVTRAQVIELLSTLKAVFEMQHQTSLLAQRRPRPADAQYVMFERFASDLLRFFPSFPVLPALSNPLSSSV